MCEYPVTAMAGHSTQTPPGPDKLPSPNDWADLLAPGERLFWTGRPDHGGKLLQATRHERLLGASLVLIIGLMWSSFPLIEPGKRLDAGFLFGVMTLGLLFWIFFIAATRADILRRLRYAVTDRRAIVVRPARSWRLDPQLYAVSFPLDRSFNYPLVSRRPFDSIQIGTLLSQDAVQPFGHGLTHPGWGPLRPRGVGPVLFEALRDANDVKRLIHHLAKDRASGGAVQAAIDLRLGQP